MLDGLRLAVGTLTVLPVAVARVDARTAGSAMAWAPAVGAGLGTLAGLVAWLAEALGLSPLVAAVAAVATLAALTRALHLDGLADTADGLGSGAAAGEARRIMKASDIGPFGVVTLVLVLLAQVAALAELGPREAPSALVVSAATGRLAVTWACRRGGVPAARPDGLGALVAGTVPPAPLAAATGATLLGAACVALLGSLDAARAVLAVLAVLVGLAAALALLAHCRRRLGGVTGDVLGGLVETATTAALVVFASAVIR